jgi:hypothetical protein
MDRRISTLILGLYLAVLPVFPLSAANRLTLKGSVTLESGPLPFTVEYDTGREDLARKVRDWTEAWLPAAEAWLGVPLPQKNPFVIELKETVIYDWPGHPFTGQKMGGLNYGDVVRVEYASFTGDNPALLYHELGHWWFGTALPFGPDSTDWLNEGGTSFLTMGMHLSGRFPLDPVTKKAVFIYWGETLLNPLKKDAPLERDIRKEGWEDNSSLYYSKTFYCHYMLFLRLGSAGYLEFVRTLMSLGRSPADNAEVAALLGGIKKENWNKILGGWVFAGPYGSIAFADFADTDSDGLSGAEETIRGTDPRKADTDGDLLPDGFELAAGRNPLKADADAGSLIAASGPFADGDRSEWSLLPRLERNTAAGAPAGRFAGIGMLFRGGRLVFRADPGPEILPAGHDLMFCLLLDTDGDEKGDLQYNYRLSDPVHPWRYLPPTGESFYLAGLSAGYGNCHEIAVQESLLPPGDGTLRFYPIIWDDTDKKTLAEWGGWISVTRTELEAVERYRLATDLAAADSDRDGIPDAAELRAGTDPTRPDPAETLVRLAPFADGIDTEWELLGTRRGARSADDTDTGTIPSGMDIDRIRWIVSGDTLWVAVFPARRFQVPGDTFFDLAMDTDGDGRTDREFGFYPSGAGWYWVYDSGTGQSTKPEGYQVAAGEILEMAIPLTLFRKKGQAVSVYPQFWNPETKTSPEAFPGWVPLEIP